MSFSSGHQVSLLRDWVLVLRQVVSQVQALRLV
jgi:hypothetical protein